MSSAFSCGHFSLPPCPGSKLPGVKQKSFLLCKDPPYIKKQESLSRPCFLQTTLDYSGAIKWNPLENVFGIYGI
jgi:hypothetical protein